MARKTVANLETTVTARDAGFTAELNRMRNQVDRLQKQTATLSKRFTTTGLSIARSLAPSLAAFVSARAAVGGFTESIERLDSLKDAAAAIDVSVSSLAGLRYAAHFAGIETAQLDKALTRLVVRVQEAVGGDKSAQKFFAELGLNVEALKDLKPDVLFLKVSDAIAKLGNANKISAATVELFGEKQAKFIQVMRQGPGVLRAYMAEQRKLSGVTDDMVNQAEVAADSFTRLGEAFRGVKDSLSSQVSTATGTVADFLTRMMSGQFSMSGGGGITSWDPRFAPPGARPDSVTGGGEIREGWLEDVAARERKRLGLADWETLLPEDLTRERNILKDLFALVPDRISKVKQDVRLAPTVQTAGDLAQLQAEIRVGGELKSAEQKTQEKLEDMIRELKRANALLTIAFPPGSSDSTMIVEYH